jgi:hypothetical protein
MAAWRTVAGCNAARRVDPWTLYRWYADALSTAVKVALPRGLQLDAIAAGAPYFLGTKIEGFRGRGHDDYLGSHDLEDFITVIDGCPSLRQEVGEASPHLRTFLAKAMRRLLSASRFLDALPGHLPPMRRARHGIASLSAKLEALSKIG